MKPLHGSKTWRIETEITDRDLEAIVSEQVQQLEARFGLKLVQVSQKQPQTHGHSDS